ncbi:hypothetical protein [Lysobacter gummosus]|uniref:hypothetical protein n=1 Tax=Lysobacter gummosus TaxID=262324 RepID=UPI0036288783
MQPIVAKASNPPKAIILILWYGMQARPKCDLTDVLVSEPTIDVSARQWIGASQGPRQDR